MLYTAQMRKPMTTLEEKHQVFGLLKDRTDLEGLAFQKMLRAEWD